MHVKIIMNYDAQMNDMKYLGKKTFFYSSIVDEDEYDFCEEVEKNFDII